MKVRQSFRISQTIKIPDLQYMDGSDVCEAHWGPGLPDD